MSAFQGAEIYTIEFSKTRQKQVCGVTAAMGQTRQDSSQEKVGKWEDKVSSLKVWEPN